MAEIVTSSLPTPTRTIVSVKQLAGMVPAYKGKEGAIRWQLFHRQTNGLQKSGAIIRNGRKLLIDADKYFAWLEIQGEA